MMIHRMLPILVFLAAPAMAEVVPMDFAPLQDSLTDASPDVTAFDAAPTTYADIVAMANLDDDPGVITAKEREMIAVLSQVLGASPITN